MGDQFYSVGLISGAIFFVILLLTIIPRFSTIFFKKHGRSHRLIGILYLFWLLLGFYGSIRPQSWEYYLIYDISLGIIGITLTLTAASEFQYHRNAKNIASGTLDDKATVTYDEMIEHSFYQGLNLAQILYLHMISHPRWWDQWSNNSIIWIQTILLLCCTAPWLIRSRFPVNKFSDNYIKDETKTRTSALIRVLYRLKKYQYLLYKHWLLHGLNISSALLSLTSHHVSTQVSFRLFWVLLNTAYTMEFFLQTLVKKHFISQWFMLFLQQILMLASTCAALPIVIFQVSHVVAFVSLLLNLLHRKHEFMNFSSVIIFALAYRYYNTMLIGSNN